MTRPFKRRDLVAIVATAALVFVVALVPALRRTKIKAGRITCVSSLKQIGLSYRIYANDHHDFYPASVGATNPVIRAEALVGRTAPIFQALSNVLSQTLILVCPTDTRPRAVNWNELTTTNLSYFVGLDAVDTKPNMILTGDRNLALDGHLLSGVVPLGTNSPVAWTKDMHRQSGNIGLADGSVQMVTTELLRQQLKHSGDTTNLLVFPQ
jgi:hypothetical protein